MAYLEEAQEGIPRFFSHEREESSLDRTGFNYLRGDCCSLARRGLCPGVFAFMRASTLRCWNPASCDAGDAGPGRMPCSLDRLPARCPDRNRLAPEPSVDHFNTKHPARFEAGVHTTTHGVTF